jgi:acylphosphatase
MESNRVVHVLIRGRVHGVGFRAWTQHEAERRGLEGWVRNRRDGSVEALAQGNDAAVAALTAWARHGLLVRVSRKCRLPAPRPTQRSPASSSGRRSKARGGA